MNRFKIKISENGNVVRIYDNVVNDSTFKDAIELNDFPTINENQSIRTDYNFNTTPIEVTYTVIEKSIDQYRDDVTSRVLEYFITKSVANLKEQFTNTDSIDPLVLNNIKLEYIKKIDEITSLTSKEELDLLESNLFLTK
jgi:hypothetical protein